QFWLVMQFLCEMTEEQTLVMYSGHPVGLFPSHRDAPRVVITNGMVIPNYSSRDEYEKMFALGITMYGQMTAGSYCYIGPQGIVHGTVLTVLNAGRRYLGSSDLGGKVFVTAGLGGMSGAQAKAAVIAGCIGVIAEVDQAPLKKRHEQGWLMEITSDLDRCIQRIRDARMKKTPLSLGYHGNVVDLWERLVHEYDTTGELLVDLGSDQTSCHNPFSGGYCPAGLTEQEAGQLMHSEPARFRSLVQERDIFSLGFGPFRWVCTSGDPEDLAATDVIASTVLEDIGKGVSDLVRQQYDDNIRWIREAGKHNMVVGSQARILYSDQKGRVSIALAINKAIADGRIKGSVRSKPRAPPKICSPSPLGMGVLVLYLQREKLRMLDLFRRVDKTRRGKVTREDFKLVINAARIPLDKQQLDQLIVSLSCADTDLVNYKELADGRNAWNQEAWESLRNEPLLSEADRLKSPGDSLTSPGSCPSRLSCSSRFLEVPPTELSEGRPLSYEDMEDIGKWNRERRRRSESDTNSLVWREQCRLVRTGNAAVDSHALPSTLGGEDAEAVDRFRRSCFNVYMDTVQLCQRNSVPLCQRNSVPLCQRNSVPLCQRNSVPLCQRNSPSSPGQA
ncbi:UNVERIFIED_CONTAM: hypothetical protein FKN15_074251, partial [Acipenser sinensis]